MEKKYQHFRTEGTAALKAEVYTSQTPIIPFSHSGACCPESKLRNSRKSPALSSKNEFFSSRTLKQSLKNDPLLGAISKENLKSHAAASTSQNDRQLFIKGSVLTTVLAFVVILIGA